MQGCFLIKPQHDYQNQKTNSNILPHLIFKHHSNFVNYPSNAAYNKRIQWRIRLFRYQVFIISIRNGFSVLLWLPWLWTLKIQINYFEECPSIFFAPYFLITRFTLCFLSKNTRQWCVFLPLHSISSTQVQVTLLLSCLQWSFH